MARKSSTALPPVQPAITEPAMPAATFSPEALSKLLNELTAQRQELAALKEQMIQDNKRKMDTIAKAPTASMAGKTDRSLRNQIDTVKAFKKAGFGNVTPHVDVLTFNKWMAQGLRPIPGSKSLRVANLRLFHRSQCEPVTAEQKAANKAQQKAAVARHDKAAKAKGTATIHPINPQ